MTTIKLGGLTILAGANSSGKSSFFQPVLMLKQTLEAPYDPGALMLDGPHVKFTEASQFLTKKEDPGAFADFTVAVTTDTDRAESTFRKNPGRPIQILQSNYLRGKVEYRLTPDTSMDDLPSLPKEMEELVEMVSRHEGGSLELSVQRKRSFLEATLGVNRKTGHGFLLQVVSAETLGVVQAIRSIIHLPGLRGNPERTYPLNATEGSYPGPFQNYTASIIQKWKDSSEISKLAQLNDALAALGLTSEITTTTIDETRVEIRVARLFAGSQDDHVSIADVGLAVSQVLPVLVALVAAEPGQLVFVEQPELHLHPKAQVQLANIMAAAIGRGVRLLVETHSSLMLLGLQTAVAKGMLSPKSVILYWFTRDSEGATCVDKANLDKSGAFGEWPQDFADVLLDAENDYLTAAENVLLMEPHAG